MSLQTLLAFDFGLKHIGVAVGQHLTGSARPLLALKAREGIPDWQQIAQLLEEWQPAYVVVGLPLNMDGSEQEITTRARKFARRLHGRFGIKVALHDERLTTAEAKANLFTQGGYRAITKSRVDALSAAIILQSWFDSGKCV